MTSDNTTNLQTFVSFYFSDLNTINERLNDRVHEISCLLEQQETIIEFCEIDFRINTNELFI